MSLSTDLQNYRTAPVFLVEFDIYAAATFATNVAAFTWYLSFDNLYPWIDSSFLDAGWQLPYVARVGSVKSEEGFYANAGSAAAVAATPGSFWWGSGVVDGNTVSGLWVRRYDGNNPLNYPFLYGIVHGYRKGGYKEYYDDLEYEDLVLAIPGITREKNDLFNAGLSANEGGEVVLNNAGGHFDTLGKETTVTGNAIRTKIGLAHYNYESFITSFSGYIRRIKTGTRETRLIVKDNLDKFKVPIPPNTYTVAEFPFLNTTNSGKVIPLVYNSVRDFPVTCINETEVAPTSYTFKICDCEKHPISAISAAYTYDGDVRTARTITSTDLTNGTFTLAAASYTPGQVVTVDCVGYLNSGGGIIERSLAIARDLLVQYCAVQDNTQFFNDTYWFTLSALVGLAIDKETDVKTVVEELAMNTFGHLQIDDDGRFSCWVFLTTNPQDYELQDHDILSISDVDYDTEDLVAELVVNYNRRLKAGDWEKEVNTDYKDDANWLYDTFERKTIDTLLVDQANAELIGDIFMETYGVPFATVEIETSLMTYDWRITNIVKIPITRPKGPAIGYWLGELIGKTFLPDQNRMKLRFRLYQEVIT